MEPNAELPDLFRSSGGGDKPARAGTKVCWAENAAQAHKTAHRPRADESLPGELAQIPPTPRHSEQANQPVTEQMVGEAIPHGPEPVVRSLTQYADAGYDEVYVQQIGPGQEGFFRFYKEEVRPRLG